MKNERLAIIVLMASVVFPIGHSALARFDGGGNGLFYGNFTDPKSSSRAEAAALSEAMSECYWDGYEECQKMGGRSSKSRDGYEAEAIVRGFKQNNDITPLEIGPAVDRDLGKCKREASRNSKLECEGNGFRRQCDVKVVAAAPDFEELYDSKGKSKGIEVTYSCVAIIHAR